jgi:hypothetical protein
MPKATRRLPLGPAAAGAPSPDRAAARVRVTGRNGSAESDANRDARIDALLESIQQTLETQFRRIAAMQAELDHLKATKPLR